MYRCEITNRVSRPTDKLTKVVAVTRERTYTAHLKNEETNLVEEVFVSRGWEVVRELLLSQEGANIWGSWGDDQRKDWLNTHP